MTLSCLFLGDMHLDGMTADLGTHANRLQIAEYARAEGWAVRNGIDTVIYLGDVCNRGVMSYEAHGLLCVLWEKHPHLKRHVIIGNHDYLEHGKHSLTLIKIMSEQGAFGGNLKVYDEPTQVTLSGVRVNMLPYPYPNMDVEFSTANCINVSHFEVKGATRDNGGKSNGKLTVLPDTVWVMGHLHTSQDVGLVHYPGTLYQRNFGESLPKSFTHLRARISHHGQLQVKLNRIPVEPDFRLVNLNIETKADLKKITSNVLHKHKLFVSAAVRLPDNFLAQHPNVLRQDNYKTGKERDAFVNSQIITNQTCEQDDPYDSLPDYLEAKHGHLNKRQVARATDIMQEIQSKLTSP